MDEEKRVRVPITPQYAEVAQLVRAGILYIQGPGRKALLPYKYVPLDKLAKSPVCKTVIIGSNPIGDSNRGGGVNPFLG